MKERHQSILRVGQVIATLLLFALVFLMMFFVQGIQGTARVVNFAGLVRGETQRLVKLEIAEDPQDEIIERLDTRLAGLQNGSEALDLIKIETASYQQKVAEVAKLWLVLKEEIQAVRSLGWRETDIVAISEAYFALTDEMVAEAEQYSQDCATNIRRTELGINLVIGLLVLILIYRTGDAIRTKRMNSELDKKVYLDGQTGLPNKNKCELLLDVPGAVAVPTCCFMFDLNNLKYTNEMMGREAGDALIESFARCLRGAAPERYFVGRYGGDEFIALLTGASEEDVELLLTAVRARVDAHNAGGEQPISYAVGHASSWEHNEPSLRELLALADEAMYENKNHTKKESEEMQKRQDHILSQMLEAIGQAYSDSCFCDARTGRYRLMSSSGAPLLPADGDFDEEFSKLALSHMPPAEAEEFCAQFTLSAIKERISAPKQIYAVDCHWTFPEERWWQVSVLYVDSDSKGELYHYVVTFQENTEEKVLEYVATHDELTGLLNRSAAFRRIDALIREDAEGQKAMLVLDMDNFKQINDRFGHSAGDEALRIFAAALRSRFRKEDVVARYGGDEFFVYLAGAGPELLARKGREVIEEVRRRFGEQESFQSAGVSIGASCMVGPVSSEQLFRSADKALYQAKSNGKNCYALCEDEL